SAALGQKPVSLFRIPGPLERTEPADDGVVVVGPRVHDAVPREAMRLVVPEVARKGELEHAHPGELELVAQRVHLVRDEPEIFGDERQASESSPRLLEEIPARHDGELALACRRGARGHLPAAVKADEVIEANGVEAVE